MKMVILHVILSTVTPADTLSVKGIPFAAASADFEVQANACTPQFIEGFKSSMVKMNRIDLKKYNLDVTCKEKA